VCGFISERRLLLFPSEKRQQSSAEMSKTEVNKNTENKIMRSGVLFAKRECGRFSLALPVILFLHFRNQGIFQ